MSTERVELSAPEMDCSSCAGKVHSALEGIDGVVEIETRPTAGVVVVEYDGEAVDIGALVSSMEAAGYEVVDTEGRLTEGTAVWQSDRAYATYAGAVALLVGAIVSVGPVPDPLVVDVLRETTLSDVLYIAAAAVAGVPVVRAGYRSAKLRELDIDLLMGVAILAALGVGLSGFGLLDEVDDACEGRLVAGGGREDFEVASIDDRPGVHLVAVSLVDRDGLAGNR